jgi:hypothetical protein
LGSYGSSSQYSEDLVFKNCGSSSFNSEEIEQIQSECDAIEGEFGKNKISGYECLCEKPNFLGKDRCLEDRLVELQYN